MHYKNLALITGVAVTALAAQGNAAVIAGSYADVGDADFNLTTLGTVDWAYWTGQGTGTPSNEKLTGTLIGNITAIGGDGVSGSTSSTLPAFDFDFVDGTSPVTGTANNPTGRFNNPTNTAGIGVSLDLTLPTTDTYTINLFASAFRVDISTFTASIDGASDFVSTGLDHAGSGSKQGGLYTLSVTPDTAGDVLSLDLILTDIGSNGFANVGYSAITVSATPIPEPASAAVAMMGLGLLATRRRR